MYAMSFQYVVLQNLPPSLFSNFVLIDLALVSNQNYVEECSVVHPLANSDLILT